MARIIRNLARYPVSEMTFSTPPDPEYVIHYGDDILGTIALERKPYFVPPTTGDREQHKGKGVREVYDDCSDLKISHWDAFASAQREAWSKQPDPLSTLSTSDNIPLAPMTSLELCSGTGYRSCNSESCYLKKTKSSSHS